MFTESNDECSASMFAMCVALPSPMEECLHLSSYQQEPLFSFATDAEKRSAMYIIHGELG